jgi:hypothetical protein
MASTTVPQRSTLGAGLQCDERSRQGGERVRFSEISVGTMTLCLIAVKTFVDLHHVSSAYLIPVLIAAISRHSSLQLAVWGPQLSSSIRRSTTSGSTIPNSFSTFRRSSWWRWSPVSSPSAHRSMPGQRASTKLKCARFMRCRRHYPGGTLGCLCRSTSPGVAAFPVTQPGRLPHWTFRGLLSVQSLRPASSRSH